MLVEEARDPQSEELGAEELQEGVKSKAVVYPERVEGPSRSSDYPVGGRLQRFASSWRGEGNFNYVGFWVHIYIYIITCMILE